jgi:hypothetical protein
MGRNRSQLGPDWVRPHWLEQQIDRADRTWTMVGNLTSPHAGIVDPRGLVTTWPDGWSLDWWVGAEDRWHLPSRETSGRVHQQLLDGAPVVETAMRVPGGQIIHRTYAIHGDDELVIVEVENESRVPVALAVAVRPYNALGPAVIKRIGMQGDTAVAVNGRTALLLPKRPAHAAMSSADRGDSAATVLSGVAPPELPAGVRDRTGMAQAAFVFPLTHSTSLRFALPMVAARRRAGWAPTYPTVLPTAAQVANGWNIQLARGMRLVLPDERLQQAVDACRSNLLLLHDGLLEAVDQVAADDDRPPTLERLEWLLDAATPTWTWPEPIRHHGRMASELLALVRNMLVRESTGGEPSLALCSVVPDRWVGQGIEVHDAPTSHGRLSYAIRWHGARPAILWELEPHGDRRGPVSLAAPGLDPSWRTVEPRGDALLAPVRPEVGRSFT